MIRILRKTKRSAPAILWGCAALLFVFFLLYSGVSVCDCYGYWKELSKTEDVTQLLANRINHPTKEMHKLFADMLYEVIMSGAGEEQGQESTMTTKA